MLHDVQETHSYYTQTKMDKWDDDYMHIYLFDNKRSPPLKAIYNQP